MTGTAGRRPGTFVLVHGSWHGGWCWARLARRLVAAGHRVLAPSLTGHADRAHLLSPAVGLSTHVEDIAALLVHEEIDDAVLLGHSYGGMVVTGVADRLPGRIRLLAYLDAHVPDDGQSMCDLIGEAVTQRLRARVEAEGFGWILPASPAAMFGTGGEDAAWIDRKATPMPWRCYAEPVALAGGLADVRARAYLRCTRHERVYFDAAAGRARAAGWPVRALPAAHNAMITHPDLLAEALLALLAETAQP